MTKTSLPFLVFYTLIVYLMGCSQTAYRSQTNAQTVPPSDRSLAIAEKQQSHTKQVAAPSTHYHIAVEEIKEIETVDSNGQKVKQLAVVFAVSKSIK